MNDTFFDLGGKSLLSIRVISEIHRHTGVRIEFSDMILQTLRQLAAKCAEPAER